MERRERGAELAWPRLFRSVGRWEGKRNISGIPNELRRQMVLLGIGRPLPLPSSPGWAAVLLH